MARSETRHGERGQVLPLWTLGGITTLALMFLAINYANAVRYQIRAQNAADSAAQAAIAIQAQRWNLMNMMLYTSNVEEYRTRRTLNSMLLAIDGSGGCTLSQNPFVYVALGASDASSPGSCEVLYQRDRHEYLKSVNRYTADIALLEDATGGYTFADWSKDAASLVTQLGKGATGCLNSKAATTSASLGDCGMSYTITGVGQRGNLQPVEEDSSNIFITSFGKPDPYPATPTAANVALWAPPEIEIATCVIVPPIIPNFGPIHLAPTYAVGRAAASAVMVEEDWLDPGALTDPARGSPTSPVVFQPFEEYAQTSGADAGNTSLYDWYGVDYGGNPSYAFPSTGGFTNQLTSDEMSARVGWWNAIPIKLFGAQGTNGTISTGALSCPTAG